MSKIYNYIILFSILLASAAAMHMPSPAYAQSSGQDTPTPAKTPIERVSPGVFRIGNIMLNKATRSIVFPASLNMGEGLLEYLIVTSSGKTHESLLRTEVNPYNLQLAFLLLDFESTAQPLTAQGDPDKPSGEPVEIVIEYNDSDGKPVKIDAGKWISQLIDNTESKPGKLEWIYTGSVIVNGQFLAQNTGSIAAIFHDPAAIVDNASAGGENDDIWIVNKEAVPVLGTLVTINITARK